MKRYAVFLSSIAERKLDMLLEYLYATWGISSKEKYIRKLRQVTNLISTNPRSCQESEEMKGIFKCIVTKQSSFFYRILNQEIEIITFFDNRQNQKTVFEELNKHYLST